MHIPWLASVLPAIICIGVAFGLLLRRKAARRFENGTLGTAHGQRRPAAEELT